MIKRVTWFVAGAAAGAAGTTYASRKIKAKAAQLAPARVARGAVHSVQNRGRDLVEAVREGRSAMRLKEDELRAERDARGPAGARAQIIILSEARDIERLERQVSPQHPAVARPKRSRR
jgi:hypothetical protein